MAEISDLKVQVSDYYFVGDGSHYEKHFFVLNVSADSFEYSVDRSYVDFVEFDRLIRKKFPESIFDLLPLKDVKYVRKLLSREAASSSSIRASIGSTLLPSSRTSIIHHNRESIINSGALTAESGGDMSVSSGAMFPVVSESKENIAQARELLGSYVQNLMKKIEILRSEEFLKFLDEETRQFTNGWNCASEEPLSTHDLLLFNNAINKCVVNRSDEYQYHVPRGSLILWRFSTQFYDIGFSVEMNGVVKVPYTRCNSHKVPVCGTLEANEPSICVLKWDNSYAKCTW
jgi:hypothetical protein